MNDKNSKPCEHALGGPEGSSQAPEAQEQGKTDCTNCIYLRGQAVEFWAAYFLEKSRLEPWKLASMNAKSLLLDSLKETCQNSQFGTTSKPLDATQKQKATLNSCEPSEEACALAPVFHVRISASQERAPESVGAVQDYGRNRRESSRRYAPPKSSLKIARLSENAGELKSSDGLPNWGTFALGERLRRIRSAHTIKGRVGGVLDYPTPMTRGLIGGSGARKKVLNMDHLTKEEKRVLSTGYESIVNPEWVEYLMGWPIGWTKTRAGNFGTRRKKDFRESAGTMTEKPERRE